MVGVLLRNNVMEGDERTGRLRQIAGLWKTRLPSHRLRWMPGARSSMPLQKTAKRWRTRRPVPKTEDWPHSQNARVRVGRSPMQTDHLEAELGAVLLRQLYNEEEAVQHLETRVGEGLPKPLPSSSSGFTSAQASGTKPSRSCCDGPMHPTTKSVWPACSGLRRPVWR